EIARGRKVAPGVRAWVVPGSETVKREAVAEGLDKVFVEAGFQWREPGCSMCLAANGETVAPGQRSVSTSNRNFVGRQGPRARTPLASPASGAAAAIAGALAAGRKKGGQNGGAGQQTGCDSGPDYAEQHRHRCHHPHRAAGRKFGARDARHMGIWLASLPR